MRRFLLKIILNGEQLETNAQNLAQLCHELGFGDAKVATARNGDFIPKHVRTQTALQHNDRIEIVSPRQGG